MTDPAGHIAVVGGGTAGWLAALLLHSASKRAGKALRVSVVESPDIPTVGVGEGSTAFFRSVLKTLELDEREFLRETGATLKFGIHHRGWRKDRRDYFGPIDDPNLLDAAPDALPANWLHQAQIAAGEEVAPAHLFTWLMRGRKSAWTPKGLAVSPFDHAYHFDQARLGRYLASKAEGIAHIRAEVSGLERDGQTGDVTALALKDAPPLPVDLVIDCTGFRRAILGPMGADWVSYSDILPLNRAMPFWLDHDESRDIAPFTTAQALSSGWMWGIPVQDRMGCGYVYSDAHVTADAAQAELERHLGRKIEPRGSIPINPGRVREAWIGNVVALGLAQSFLEPLEATSIHGTLVQIVLFLGDFDFAALMSGKTAARRRAYNAKVAQQVDDFAQFINLHYAGGREDSAFWRAMTEDGLSDQTRDRLAQWRNAPVLPSDFPEFLPGLPHMGSELYTPVLDGLGHLSPHAAKTAFAQPAQKAQARKLTRSRISEFKSAARQAQGHRAFLKSLA